MNHETIRDYLIRSDMNESQAEALSRIFSEMATRSDLLNLEERMRAELGTMHTEVRVEFANVRTELATVRTELATVRAELTWKMIAIVGFFATASTLLNLFVG